jgi:hypothetical protein
MHTNRIKEIDCLELRRFVQFCANLGLNIRFEKSSAGSIPAPGTNKIAGAFEAAFKHAAPFRFAV